MFKKMMLGVAALALLGLTSCGASCEECAKLEDGETCAACAVEDAKEEVSEAADEAIDDAQDALEGLKSDG